MSPQIDNNEYKQSTPVVSHAGVLVQQINAYLRARCFEQLSFLSHVQLSIYRDFRESCNMSDAPQRVCVYEIGADLRGTHPEFCSSHNHAPPAIMSANAAEFHEYLKTAYWLSL